MTGFLIMFKNNRGFFFPTLMVYIIIFLILLTFMVYNNLANQIMLKSVEQEVYYEEALLQSTEYIQEVINSKEAYDKVCQSLSSQQKTITKNLQVQGFCIISLVDDFYDKFKHRVPKDTQELPLSEYNQGLQEIQAFNKRQKFLIDTSFLEEYCKELFRKYVDEPLEEFPEWDELKELADKLVNQYIIFNIETKANTLLAEPEKVLIFYDCDLKKVRMIVHT